MRRSWEAVWQLFATRDMKVVVELIENFLLHDLHTAFPSVFEKYFHTFDSTLFFLGSEEVDPDALDVEHSNKSGDSGKTSLTSS